MTGPRLAWGIFGLWVAMSAAGVAFATQQEEAYILVLAPALAGFALVGALIASRHPGNAIGWLLQAVAVLLAFTNLIEGYVVTSDHPSPVAVWLDDWVSNVWILLVGVWIPLLFPDGRLPSPRWRLVAWSGTAAFTVAILGYALGDRVLDTSAPGTVHNPYALPGDAGDLAASIAPVAEFGLIPAVLGALAGLVVRMRRSRGIERQQLKWFAFVGALMLGALFLAAASLIDPDRLGDNVGSVGWGAFILLTVLGLPAAMGAAILRHRLYDIDLVINRTLVYGALTATLAATYLGLVLLIGLTVGHSDVAIAISTLAVAALFRPARARIQGAVDRRFYRRRYDARQTLEAFGARLRDEVDLEAVGAELGAAVRDTVQPTHLTLWLPPDRRTT